MPITLIPHMRAKPVFRLVEVAFEYSDDIHTWDVVAQVETDGRDSYTMIMVDGIDDASDEIYDIVKAKAEEKAWEKDQQEPKNKRTGCNCLPTTAGDSLEALQHERDCPLRLSAEERRTYDSYNTDHEQANSHDSTWVYLNLK